MKKWTRSKPSTPGAYWLRSFVIGHPARQALVEVRRWRGGLICSLHKSHGVYDYDDWFRVADLSPRFRWCGPLEPVQ